MSPTPESSPSVASLLAAGILVRVEPDPAVVTRVMGIAHQHLTAAGVVNYDLAEVSLALQACRSALVAAACAAGYAIDTSIYRSENVLDPALATAAAELPRTEVAIAAFTELRAAWARSEEELDIAAFNGLRAAWARSEEEPDGAIDAPRALEVANAALAAVEAAV